jgi:hypothetical protein
LTPNLVPCFSLIKRLRFIHLKPHVIIPNSPCALISLFCDMIFVKQLHIPLSDFWTDGGLPWKILCEFCLNFIAPFISFSCSFACTKKFLNVLSYPFFVFLFKCLSCLSKTVIGNWDSISRIFLSRNSSLLPLI